ncbi:MAG: GAF domain-containing protein [Candidatus Omnitrophota bacterium]
MTIPNVIPDSVIQEWQEIVDILAEVNNAPAALIMRIVEEDIEVFAASRHLDNPYRLGEKERLIGSGLYCETVIKTKKKLLVPNALTDEKWKKNPDIHLGMISYFGFPLFHPNGEPFGTICVLDKKENHFSDITERLMMRFKNLIQHNLELIYVNSILGEENKKLTDYLSEIQTLREIIPICSYCKKIRTENGEWEQLEEYLAKHTRSAFSHGFCPECGKKHYGR